MVEVSMEFDQCERVYCVKVRLVRDYGTLSTSRYVPAVLADTIPEVVGELEQELCKLLGEL